MRFKVVGVLASFLPFGASAAAPPPSKPALGTQVVPKTCDTREPRLAKSREVRVFRDPRDFQPVDLHYAVDRRVDNCPVPAIVRRNVGR